MPRNVSVNSGSMRFAQNISVGAQAFQADEPSENGGNDAGPNPHELLLAALGACASYHGSDVRRQKAVAS
jgi:putative redox protein